MQIQIDTREKAKAIQKILQEFNRQGAVQISSKLYVGDYMNYDNPRLVVDRKQNLSELCGNVCQDHNRFRNELLRANEAGIKIVFLCEHGKGIKSLEDVQNWINPRRYARVKSATTGRWETFETKAMTGEKLYKVLSTIKIKYGCDFLFCSKGETGKKIIEILRR